MLRRRVSVAEEEEDLTWDIEDDDHSVKTISYRKSKICNQKCDHRFRDINVEDG